MDKRIRLIIDFITKGHKVVETTSASIKNLPKSKTTKLSIVDKATSPIRAINSSIRKQAQSITALSSGYMALAQIYTRVKTAINNLIQPFKSFEQTMANVRAVSGATEDEFRSLEAQALELGRTTKFTATQVSQLQVEFSKLGFTADEINKVTAGTLALAAATGEDLAQSATVAGATLRGFALDAKETVRVTDVMAKSFSSSALDLSKFQEAMKMVAPIARAAGYSVEQTTTLLAKLADVGLYGSLAGTALKNIFLQMENSGSKLNDLFKNQVHTYDQLVAKLQSLKEGNFSLAEATQFLGRRSAAAFLSLVKQSDALDGFNKNLILAGGSAQHMADIQMATLEGATLRLKSAQEGLSIAFVDKFAPALVDVKNTLTSVTSAITEMLETPLEQEMQKDRIAFETTAVTLQRLWEKTELNTVEMKALNQAISDAQALYPDYLSNISKEKTSYEELTKAIEDARKALIDKARQNLFLARQKEIIDEIAKAQDEAVERQLFADKIAAQLALDQEKRAAGQITGMINENDLLNLKNKSIKESEELMQRASELQKQLTAEAEKYEAAWGSITKKVEPSVNEIEVALDTIPDMVNDLTQEIDTLLGEDTESTLLDHLFGEGDDLSEMIDAATNATVEWSDKQLSVISDFNQKTKQLNGDHYVASMMQVDEYYRRKHDALIEAGLTEEQITAQIEASKDAIRKQYEQRALNGAGTMFGNMAKVAKAGGKKGFLAWKRFSQAQALIDTYKAANSAYAAMAGIPIVGPGLGAIAAAAAIAAGMVNVKTIEMQKFGKGGIADEPSIFGEAGPEAAVPLPDGKSIPVTMKSGGGESKQLDQILKAIQAVNANIAALNLSVTIETTDPETRIRNDNEIINIMKGAGDDGQPL